MEHTPRSNTRVQLRCNTAELLKLFNQCFFYGMLGTRVGKTFAAFSRFQADGAFLRPWVLSLHPVLMSAKARRHLVGMSPNVAQMSAHSGGAI